MIGLVPTALYPLNEVENDHRMFLPFVGLSLAVVCAGANLVALCSFARVRQAVAWTAAVAVLPVLGWGTHLRNEVWHTDETLWRDDIKKCPNNARGYFSLGFSLWLVPGRLPEAISDYETALRLKPDYKDAHRDLGLALAKAGRLPEAIAHYQAAIRIDPYYPEAHNDLGIALAQVPGRLPAAISEFRKAAELKPDYADPHENLGIALSQIPGRMPEAVSELEAAYRIRPEPTLRRVLDQLQKN